MRTAVTDMLGIEFPILAFSHCRDVVAEVSKAGGLGVLGAISHTPEQLELELQWIVEHANGAPFGVDVLLPSTEKPMTGDIPKEHLDFVGELLRRHGIDITEAAAVPEFSERKAITDLSGELLEVAFRYPISLVASALGTPSPEMVEGAKSRGVKVAALAGKVSHARRHVEAGVDIVIAQGHEAGGHTGEVTTMVLVPEVVDAVAPVPVLAAGGIGRGRQMAAALALGAQGVWCGSVWLTTEEAETHPVVKEKFLEAGSADTVRSRYRTGKPARQLRSAWTDAWEQPDAPGPLSMPQQIKLAEEALVRAEKAAQRDSGPARELVTYFVGQIVGSMNRVKTTRQVVFDLVDELIDATRSLNEALEDDSEAAVGPASR